MKGSLYLLSKIKYLYTMFKMYLYPLLVFTFLIGSICLAIITILIGSRSMVIFYIISHLAIIIWFRWDKHLAGWYGFGEEKEGNE